jgi:hypothetical protein
MSTFDKREKAFEGKFAHDEHVNFSIQARRNKLAGLWAAEKMGLTGEAADAYAKEVIVADMEEAGDGDVIRKLKADLAAKNIVHTDEEIAAVLDAMLQKAKQQLAEG